MQNIDAMKVAAQKQGRVESCLCPVDIEATLTKAGYVFKKTPFGYEAEKA